MMKFLLKREKSFVGKVRNIFAAYALSVCWLAFAVAFLTLLYTPLGEIPKVAYKPFLQFPFFSPPPQYLFFFAVIFAPLWEELAFRVAPIRLMKILGGKKTLPYVIVLSSIIFGIGHGGVENIIIQGISGLFLAGVYIKNGYSYWSSVAVHAMWNFMLMYGLPILLR